VKTEDQLFDEWCEKDNIPDDVKNANREGLKDTLPFQWYVVSCRMADFIASLAKYI